MRRTTTVALGIILMTASNIDEVAHGQLNDASEIHKKSLPSVVYLICRAKPNDPRPKIGTGFLIKNDSGKIVVITNAHVIKDAVAIDAMFSDGRTRFCQFIDRHEDLDLAALSFAGEGEEDSLPVLELRDQAASFPDIGTKVIMIGHPSNLKWTMHQGAVSKIATLQDLVNAGIRLFSGGVAPRQEFIQLDITSIQGFSGAPVIDLAGQVIAVESEGMVDGLSGINFSIPIKNLKELDTSKPSVNFSDEVASRLSGDLSGTRLTQQVVVLHEADDSTMVPSALMQSKTWGVVPPDGNFIFNNMIGDRGKFKDFIHLNHLNEILGRWQVVHVTNPFFGYSFLLPESFAVRETIDVDNLSSQIVLTNKDPGLAAPLNSMTITATKRRPPARGELYQAFSGMINEHKREVLRINQQPLGAINDDPTREFVVVSNFFSDFQPRIHSQKNIARFTQIYSFQENLERSHYVFFAIKDDTFLVVEFRFNNSNLLADHTSRFGWEANYIERVFIAASLSLYE